MAKSGRSTAVSRQDRQPDRAAVGQADTAAPAAELPGSDSLAAELARIDRDAALEKDRVMRRHLEVLRGRRSALILATGDEALAGLDRQICDVERQVQGQPALLPRSVPPATEAAKTGRTRRTRAQVADFRRQVEADGLKLLEQLRRLGRPAVTSELAGLSQTGKVAAALAPHIRSGQVRRSGAGRATTYAWAGK